ncbi:MAG TPA: GNAT family N-acetyltransferase [Bryobacteraceae bacterium]|nr:GNAT family N-acetyltransferase [Bryobacteraceae bacterium]
MTALTQTEITVRRAAPADAAACGQICYDAFQAINTAHGFPSDIPGVEAAVGLLTTLFSHPGCWCAVAEAGGRIVGSNCIDERSVIAGIGPITVDPQTQNSGIGRKLMEAAIGHAQGRGVAGIRLVQAAFHNRSLALYTQLGFEIREPLSCLQGRTRTRSIPGCAVRPATTADLEACNAIARQVHGFDRGAELAESVKAGHALVVEREGRITGYTTGLAFFGHGVAESNVEMQALMAAAESFGGPGILIPSRNYGLLRWCLANGLRVVQPMTLMAMGLYNDPAGAWFPSILF